MVNLTLRSLPMARRLIPIVEVTAPDGSKSFWAAVSIAYKDAVGAVKGKIPPDHAAQLSMRRLPIRLKLDKARKGDVIRIEL